ncbi:hypothetical protein VTL71DRAFT_14452 [Oculimacula yallundae]|uniref:Serine hydrolase domain-containing protein n=1 Tax=Oculimacula yallundae TaxID=86028 RepID=A0ABR4CKK5_9HELO
MRFLCLHGYGTNSTILEATFAPIRAHLPANWEFQFLDGLVEVPPTPGVGDIYPGPFCCYHGEPTLQDLQAVYELCMEVVEEDGPFDAILGFSQGSAMAATIMLHEAEKRTSLQPFKMGVFLSTTMPFNFGSGILRLQYNNEKSRLNATHLDDSGNPIIQNCHVDWLTDCRSKTVIEEFEARRPASSVKGVAMEVDVLLRYHPSTYSQRLRLPTVHVVGMNDSYADQGMDMFRLCDPNYATLITHDGGHQSTMLATSITQKLWANTNQYMSSFQTTSFPLSCAYLLFAFLLYQLCTATYNITLHPLASVPGPKLAGATLFYQTFWGTYRNESIFYKHVASLHERYGPIIRITPTEVSISEPDKYEKIYYIGSKYCKSAEYYSVFGATTAIFTSIDNRVHLKRRAPLNAFFSRQSVFNIQGSVQEKVRTVCHRLDGEFGKNGVAPLHHMFNALSLDVASGYLFNHSFDSLHEQDYSIPFTNMVKDVLSVFWVMVQSSIFCNMVKSLPQFITKVNPSLRGYHQLFHDTKKIVHKVINEASDGKILSQRSSIFHTLLDPPATEGFEKAKDYDPPSEQQLTDNGVSILVAAASTTGNSMMVSSYHILSNKNIYARLRREIMENFPRNSGPQELDYAALERLPYLTGCIKEGLRLSYGAIGRLPRTIPAGGVMFYGYHLPPGYKIGMSTWSMHRNPVIWPNPDRFDPDRWTDPDEAKRLNKYMVSFGKDSRNCLGMNLALCEIYLMVATLIREYDDLEVYDMTDADLSFNDKFAASQQEHCKEFRVHRTGKSVDLIL